MLASTQASDYISYHPRARDGNISPSCRAAHIRTPPRRASNYSYDSPMLTPSPLRTRPVCSSDFCSNTNDSDDIFLQSPFNYTPLHISPMKTFQTPTGVEGRPKCLASGPPRPLSPVFFPTSDSPPLHTPVKQAHRVPSRSALSVKHMNALPMPPPATETTVSGHGTKRKSVANFSTPLRRRTFTPLNISTKNANSISGGIAFDRLAPLPAPRFTPHTKAETEVYLKTQTSTMTQLSISDLNDSEKDFGTDGDDSGCEIGDDENDTGDRLFLDIGGRTKKSDLERGSGTGKGKGKNEVVEAISPDGHITKRRARARPRSADLVESVHSSRSSSPGTDDIGPIRSKGRIPNGNGFRTAPFTQPRIGVQIPSLDPSSPLPRRRVTTTAARFPTRQPGFDHVPPPRAPLNRHESSGTLFFGPAIPPIATETTKQNSTMSPSDNVWSRKNVPQRHGWGAIQSNSRSPSPHLSPRCLMSEHGADDSDEDMFFGGPTESSFMFNVTGGTPSPISKKSEAQVELPKKYKPRDSGIVLSDDDDIGAGKAYLNVMPKASRSDGSIYSDGDEGLVTPGAGPSPVSGWPEAAVVVNSFFDEMSENVVGHGESELNVDEFILRTLAAGAKGPQEGAKKVPGTPVKKVKTTHFGGERPWQSAVANKVGFGVELGGRNGPRKSLPAAFPMDMNVDDSEGEGEEISPSMRRPAASMKENVRDDSTNLPRARWLMRRSSSGAFSSSESSVGTPTGLRGRDLNVPTTRMPTQFSPSKNRVKLSASPPGRHLKTQTRTEPRKEGVGRLDRDFVQVDEVGSGEFGNVIKVRCKTGCEGEVFAVKKSKRFEGVKHRIRLREEVSILEHLSRVAFVATGGRHSNVLAYVDSWEEDERLFIRTELCELGNFARFLWEYGRVFPRLDEGRVWKIIADLSNGMRFIHAAGVIHMDLKPANIFVTSEGRLKIGDFGMASLWPRRSEGEGGTFEREGDKLYLAPEVLQGEYGKAADVFSLGMTILETASNIVVPDQGEPWHRLRSEKFEEVDLSDRPELLGLIKKMMRRKAELRVSMEEVYGHWMVRKARDYMERAYDEAIRKGRSVFCASPLAAVV